MTLSEIAAAIGGEIHGDGSKENSAVASLEEATAGTISFLADARKAQKIAQSRASALLLPPGVKSGKVAYVTCRNPLIAFTDVIRIFHPIPSPKGVDPRAVVEKEVTLGEDVTLYPNAYVGRGAVLGKRVTLHPGVSVGAGSVIGDDTLIYPNAVIYDHCEVGKRVIIHSGAVIGSDGYGFVWDGQQHKKIPQVGKVVIGDDVEIGANCTIDRATLGKTEIKRGTKLDNLVHVAHNCSIGEQCLLVAQVGISGSVELGRKVILAGQSGVVDHVKIGDGAIIGAKAGVTKDIEAGAKVSGFPPLPHMEWMRIQKSIEKVPEMRKELVRLIRRIENPEKKENK